MHPLSMFPQLLTYGLLAPLLLRVSVGGYLLSIGWGKYKKTGKDKWLSFIYFITGILLVIGLYTQITTLIDLVFLAFEAYSEKIKSLSCEKQMLYVFAGVVLFSLLFTGPGLFAFDLPL